MNNKRKIIKKVDKLKKKIHKKNEKIKQLKIELIPLIHNLHFLEEEGKEDE